jgi:hypothetical protein
MIQLFDHYGLVAELVREICVLTNIEFAFIKEARSLLKLHIWLIVHMVFYCWIDLF